MATYMAKVRKFEDGLMLSILGKIVGFLIQDMDSMVMTAMAIEREREREREDARSIRGSGINGKMKEGQPSSSSGNKLKDSSSCEFQGQGHGYQCQGHIRAPIQSGSMTCFHFNHPGHMRRDYP